MKSKIAPKFHGLRIYLVSTLLYLFLVMPFVTFMGLQNIPEQFLENNNFISFGNAEKDSVVKNDTIIQQIIDSALVDAGVEDILTYEEIQEIDTIAAIVDSKISDIQNQAEKEFKEKKKGQFLARFFKVYFRWLLVSFILGLFFNFPFKRFLNRTRKKRSINPKLKVFCSRYILHTAKINLLILLLPYIFSHGMALLYLIKVKADTTDVQRMMFNNFLMVSVVAALLTLLFVYFWQRNRVHLKYIEFFFTAEQLQKRIFKSKTGKIGFQLWLSSIITTTFPLAIVVLYFVLSLTSVKDLHIEELTEDHYEILLGKWVEMSHVVQDWNMDEISFSNLYYVTAIDNIIMLIGMGTGILVSIFYLLIILKWNTRSIVNPVNELLGNMQKIQKDGTTDYTIVRTNDEVGILAEGFNVMITKIRDYISDISDMNKDLERKVIERTKEIADQKEEIESQKEEIESQLEMVTGQKDTIEKQKHQIVDSIHYARRIQNAMLPPEDSLAGALKDYFVFYYPRDIVSGDFYWNTVKDDKLYIAVADCTGHGVPGAFLSILGVSFLNEIVNKEASVSAAVILDQLRTSIIKSLHQKGQEGEAQDGMEIALCIIDRKKNTLQYAGARRPLYLVRSNDVKKKATNKKNERIVIEKNETHQLIQYKPDGMPIGIYDEGDQAFTNLNVKLEEGDAIYLFTDGYVDQLGGLDRKTFRVKNFRKMLLDIQGENMAGQRKELEKRIVKWMGKIEQIDDVMVLGMKI